MAVTQQRINAIENVKYLIAVASGKGGVGKSTTTVNLALALAKQGARVGILDADIYGPSIPHMLGATERPQSIDGKKLKPVICQGLQTMSIAYLVDQDDTPMIWRGPMATSALQQLLNDTLWDNLDYLFIDLPPGTGDIQLTMSQKIPVDGAVIVTTPQDIALLDARKALKMFEKVTIPVLGILENMATHVCSACGHEEAIFGAGGGASMAGQYGTELLASLPLDRSIREQMDAGTPAAIASQVLDQYDTAAQAIKNKLAGQAKNYAKKFPKIVVEHV